jgi:hypothetical protein
VTSSRPSPEPIIERLYTLAVEHVNALSTGEAAGWIRYHGLLSLADDDRVPEAVREGVAEDRTRNLAVSVLRVWQFQEVVDALGDIPVCALKGVLLLDTVYADNPEDRILWDVDVLVAAEHADEAFERLTALLELTETRESFDCRQRSHHRTLVKKNFSLEVHTRLGIKHGSFSTWSELEPVAMRIHDRDVYALDRETLIVHLIAHFVKHRPFSCLKWVVDILLLAEEPIDWVRVVDRAKALGAHRSLVAGIRMIRRLLGNDALVGTPTSAGITSQVLVLLNERWMWRSLVANGLAGVRQTSRFERGVTAVLLSGSLGDALRFARFKTQR